MAPIKIRNWVFTIENYVEAEWERIAEIPTKYTLACKAIGKETGVQHLHIYFIFENPRTWKILKENFPRGAKMESRKKSHEAMKRYIVNQALQLYQSGEEPLGQGSRSDLEEVVTMIKDNKNINEIMEECPIQYIKFSKGIEKLYTEHQKHRESKPEVIWLWGETGVGKTKKAVEICGPNYYIKDGTIWWDNYTGSENIIIDDFDGRWPLRDLLRLLDRYKYQGQTKGGYIKINAKIIVITSDTEPCYYYLNNREQNQLLRRIDKIEHLLGTEVTCNNSKVTSVSSLEKDKTE